jgi:hypothetical protein
MATAMVFRVRACADRGPRLTGEVDRPASLSGSSKTDTSGVRCCFGVLLRSWTSSVLSFPIRGDR